LHQNRYQRHLDFFENFGALAVFHFLFNQRSQSEGNFGIRGSIGRGRFNQHLVHCDLGFAFANQFFNVGHTGIEIIGGHIF
jgi:hypothetical protein